MQDERPLWEFEQWVIDRLVKAVEAGDGPAKEKLGKHLIEGYTAHDWNRFEVVDDGLFLPSARLEPRQAWIQDVLDAMERYDAPKERVEALSHGAPMTDLECRQWLELVVERAFDEELAYEHGAGSIWVILQVRHSRTGSCCLAVIDWAGESRSFVAAYNTRVEAVNALKGIGFISMADYLARR